MHGGISTRRRTAVVNRVDIAKSALLSAIRNTGLPLATDLRSLVVVPHSIYKQRAQPRQFVPSGLHRLGAHDARECQHRYGRRNYRQTENQ